MDKKIIIIGAGISGIAAATKLLHNGFNNIVILEADNNRYGGRINTVSFGENVVDLGAQWCHGEENNVIFELANKKNLLGHNETPHMKYASFYQSNGIEMPSVETNKLLDLYTKILNNYESEMKEYSKSVGDFVNEKQKLAIQSSEYKNMDSNLINQVHEFFSKYLTISDGGDSWYEISCKSYIEFVECTGIYFNHWKDKGYKTLFDLLKEDGISKKIVNFEEKIKFNKRVCLIEIKSNSSSSALCVKCDDGSSFNGDHVITTIPLGVLKEQYSRLFSPPLPQKKIDAIEGLCASVVDKIYLEFNKSFWPINWHGIKFLWSKLDKEELKQMKTVSMVDTWFENIIGFYCVDNQPNVLCGWVTGDSARHMEKLSEQNVIRGSMWLLRKFLPSNWNIPDAIAIKRSQWYLNPNSRGSYCFISTKCDKLKTGPADLATPITDENGKPVIQFAGEATNPLYYSTCHGALASGWREADRIIELLK